MVLIFALDKGPCRCWPDRLSPARCEAGPVQDTSEAFPADTQRFMGLGNYL